MEHTGKIEKRIGIAAPISVASLREFLPNLSLKDLQLGLGGTAVNLIIAGLIGKGYKVTVFTLDARIKDKYILEGEFIKIIFGHFRGSGKQKMFDFCYQEFKQIKSFIKEERENLSIVNAHWSYEFAIGTILAKVPHIITFRDDSPTILKLTKHPYRLIRLLMDFWVRKYGRAFIYNSIYLENLIKIEGVVIPNPIVINNKIGGRNYPEKEEDFNIFFIANGWDYRKNPEIAIEAFIKLRKTNKNLKLFLVGSGFEFEGEGYLKVKERYSLDGIVFVGYVKHEDLLVKLQDCHIMLHTSREESFGNNLIEAMSYGVPVVGGEEAGAVPWVLDYGKAGVLVDVEQVSSVASGLLTLISNKEFYEELSLRSLINVRNRFDLDIVAQLYVDAYASQIVKQKK